MRKLRTANARKGSHMDASDRVLYATLLAISYPLCLIAAVSNRVIKIFGNDASHASNSVFAEAKSAAHAAVGYAFHA